MFCNVREKSHDSPGPLGSGEIVRRVEQFFAFSGAGGAGGSGAGGAGAGGSGAGGSGAGGAGAGGSGAGGSGAGGAGGSGAGGSGRISLIIKEMYSLCNRGFK